MGVGFTGLSLLMVLCFIPGLFGQTILNLICKYTKCFINLQTFLNYFLLYKDIDFTGVLQVF